MNWLTTELNGANLAGLIILAVVPILAYVRWI